MIIDPSDITKPYARKMEHLARVRDGTKKRRPMATWLCQVLAVDRDGDRLAPLADDTNNSLMAVKRDDWLRYE